jgi:hypothetical protein
MPPSEEDHEVSPNLAGISADYAPWLADFDTGWLL